MITMKATLIGRGEQNERKEKAKGRENCRGLQRDEGDE